MLQPGDKAPDFELMDQSGQAKSFTDLSGPKGLVLYIYPRDNTSGCTAEAQEFRDLAGAYAEAGFGVAGLSKDSVKSHVNFATKHELGFPLLSDPATGLLQDLGSWREKKSRGKVSMGTVRTTFVFDAAGTLIRAYDKVKAKGHAEVVLADITGQS